MALVDLAREHYSFQRELARQAVLAVLAPWRLLDPAGLQGSWRARGVGQLLFLAVATSQRIAAEAGAAYVGLAMAEQGQTPRSAGRFDPMSLAGVASDGRGLDGLLLAPLVAALQAISGGARPADALALGERTLSRVVDTQVSDAGRVGTTVAMAAEPGTGGWVRMVNPPAAGGSPCARCIILAGVRFRWNDGFERHPNCGCVHVPYADAAGVADVRTDTMAYFRSLSGAEQDRVFTAAGAEAIRLGADVNAVVNVRRQAAGMATAAGPRRRGSRLMPEQIIEQANGDRGEAVRLLRRSGYISG